MKTTFLNLVLATVLFLSVAANAEQKTDLYVVPNFHPACMGWLAKYSVERNYCLYSYLNHQDQVLKDPSYKYVHSEIPHLVTMMEFEPERFEEFKTLLRKKRVECVNAFVLEPTVNLSGGEALIQQGVQGLQWYKQILGIKPRYCWLIDNVGFHEQTAQMVEGLGLEAFIFTRYNPTDSALFFSQSPDGTKIPAIAPGHYASLELTKLFKTQEPLTEEQLQECIDKILKKKELFPDNTPILALGGAADYSIGFKYEKYPKELIEVWNKQAPNIPIRMATISEYVDRVLPEIKSGKLDIPVATGGSKNYGWSAFWVNVPTIKQWYRRSEHGLQSAEMLATIASLNSGFSYPSQSFSNAWVLMSLNMDRNILWGVLIDSSMQDSESWDTIDRFNYVDSVSQQTTKEAMQKLTQTSSDSISLFNTVNWKRKGPVLLKLPEKTFLEGVKCQVLEDNYTVLAQMELAPMSLTSKRKQWTGLPARTVTDVSKCIETPFYTAKIDPTTGALSSLKMKPSDMELLSGPANVILAEKAGKKNYHVVLDKAERELISSSSEVAPFITVTEGELATIVEIHSDFCQNGYLYRVIRFYKDSPRIDFITETNGLASGTVISAEFPLSPKITKMRRGIPYGFSQGLIAQDNPPKSGPTKGIIPVIRWSDYSFESEAGLAFLDKGIPARELWDNTVYILLNNVCDKYHSYDVKWMNDIGQQRYEYALVLYQGSRDNANIPRMAWEYNNPVELMIGRKGASESFVETSENVLIQALRRVDNEIELRLMESLGKAGTAAVKISLPHSKVWLTNMTGRRLRVLKGKGKYNFDIRPQQIVTIRCETNSSVKNVQALRSFQPVIPSEKWEYMHNFRKPNFIGHPPR